LGVIAMLAPLVVDALLGSLLLLLAGWVVDALCAKLRDTRRRLQTEGPARLNPAGLHAPVTGPGKPHTDLVERPLRRAERTGGRGLL
jgi:hypothetical protein